MAESSVVSYWLPVWFQEIKNVSPLESAEMTLPSVLGFALFSLLTGPWATYVGYWSAFMVLGSIFIAIRGGLLTTFHVNTTTPAWIGYQCLFGIGYGLGAQAPVNMLQEIFTDGHDVSMATSVVALWSNLGRKHSHSQQWKSLYWPCDSGCSTFDRRGNIFDEAHEIAHRDFTRLRRPPDDFDAWNPPTTKWASEDDASWIVVANSWLL